MWWNKFRSLKEANGKRKTSQPSTTVDWLSSSFRHMKQTCYRLWAECIAILSRCWFGSSRVSPRVSWLINCTRLIFCIRQGAPLKMAWAHINCLGIAIANLKGLSSFESVLYRWYISYLNVLQYLSYIFLHPEKYTTICFNTSCIANQSHACISPIGRPWRTSFSTLALSIRVSIHPITWPTWWN